MDIISVLQLFGGIGLFLYGMSLMSSSMEKLAGSGLEKILEKVTTSKKRGVGSVKGWFFGTAVTGIIQNSAATTIMLIGFVNAGLMKLTQAIPVVFGSNVGSTVTSQILRLGDLGSDTIWLQMLKPSAFAPILVSVGAIITLFIKKKKLREVAGILVGLGLLFYGMSLMEAVFEPLRENETFRSLFTSFENPFIGVLTGLVITAIIQSSNASVGILQALSATGTVTYAVAVPIIIGENIGKCATTIIGGIGANKKAKRVVVSYLFFNIFGAVFFGTIIYSVHYLVGISAFSKVVNRGSIANIHFLFNFLTSVILLPFYKQVANLTGKIVGEDEAKESDLELAKLDDMLLNTPSIALAQCKNLAVKMTQAISENYQIAKSQVYEYDESCFTQLEENESFIDKCETTLSAYIMRIDKKRLTEDEARVASEILNSVSDFERLGDYCMNVAYVAKEKNENDVHFSPYGHREVETIMGAVSYTLSTTFEAFAEDNANLAMRVEPLSEIVDKLKEIIKSHHVERLQTGECGIPGGVALLDLLTSFERLSSHCSNVALHIIKRVDGDTDFDEMHGHANDSSSEEYKAMYHYYESLYINPVLNMQLTEEELVSDDETRILKSKKSGKKAADSNKQDESQKTADSKKQDEGKKTADSKKQDEGQKTADSKKQDEDKKTADSKKQDEGKKTADSKKQDEGKKTADSKKQDEGKKAADGKKQDAGKKPADGKKSGDNKKSGSKNAGNKDTKKK